MSQRESTSPDRRRHERFELFAQVHVKNAREDLVLELANVSASGALLVLGSLQRPSWIDVDRLVELAIVHPTSLASIAARGQVVRLQRDGRGLSFAVEFVNVSAELAAELSELTRLGKPQPPPLPLPQPPPLPR